MSSGHKLTFWDIHAQPGDVGATVRAQVAKAALTLQDHPDVLFASSAGGYDHSESPEIALLVPIDYNPIALQPTLERAISSEGLATRVSLKSDVRYYDFEDHEIASIDRATYISDPEVVRANIDDLVQLPRLETDTPDSKELVQQLIDYLNVVQLRADATEATQAGGGAAVSAAAVVNAQDFPSDILLEELSLSAEKYQRMKNARGDAIEAEITNLQDSLKKLSGEKNTNSAVLLMVASGLITVGKAMYAAYGAVSAAGGVAPLISSLIASVGGIASVAAIAVVVVLVIGVLWALLKP